MNDLEPIHSESIIHAVSENRKKIQIEQGNFKQNKSLTNSMVNNVYSLMIAISEHNTEQSLGALSNILIQCSQHIWRIPEWSSNRVTENLIDLVVELDDREMLLGLLSVLSKVEDFPDYCYLPFFLKCDTFFQSEDFELCEKCLNIFSTLVPKLGPSFFFEKYQADFFSHFLLSEIGFSCFNFSYELCKEPHSVVSQICLFSIESCMKNIIPPQPVIKLIDLVLSHSPSLITEISQSQITTKFQEAFDGVPREIMRISKAFVEAKLELPIPLDLLRVIFERGDDCDDWLRSIAFDVISSLIDNNFPILDLIPQVNLYNAMKYALHESSFIVKLHSGWCLIKLASSGTSAVLENLVFQGFIELSSSLLNTGEDDMICATLAFLNSMILFAEKSNLLEIVSQQLQTLSIALGDLEAPEDSEMDNLQNILELTLTRLFPESEEAQLAQIDSDGETDEFFCDEWQQAFSSKEPI